MIEMAEKCRNLPDGDRNTRSTCIQAEGGMRFVFPPYGDKIKNALLSSKVELGNEQMILSWTLTV